MVRICEEMGQDESDRPKYKISGITDANCPSMKTMNSSSLDESMSRHFPKDAPILPLILAELRRLNQSFDVAEARLAKIMSPATLSPIDNPTSPEGSARRLFPSI